MYYDDYEFQHEYNNESYAYDLDEMYEYGLRDNVYTQHDTYEMDDEYTRDSHDYSELAYRHYAWYNT